MRWDAGRVRTWEIRKVGRLRRGDVVNWEGSNKRLEYGVASGLGGGEVRRIRSGDVVELARKEVGAGSRSGTSAVGQEGGHQV